MLNVNRFLDHCILELPLQGPVLDIGPQPNSYSTKLFSGRFEYITLDIDPHSGADIIADICNMPHVPSESFNTIIVTEVLEHTTNPFLAVAELHRILRQGGYLLVTTPFNLRIHGPSPDCWRFTEEGLKILFEGRFEILELKSVVPLLRRAMPIHYTVVLRKPRYE
jgi:SAM-dependent methyltransferase